ncbi:MAG: hypothetical protein M3440_11935 [Chloroflexota bacterium]|nr:hypothetical protein [Chloroflexota bacterium]
MAGTFYNLTHLQVAAKVATPVYSDINYATNFEPTIEQDSETMNADGKKAVVAQGAPEGGGSIGFGSLNLATMGVMTGGTVSSSGTGGTAITRLEIKGTYSPPALVLVAWLPNVDGNETSAGVRITLPNAKLTMPSASFGQETWSEFSADLTFVADTPGNMLIWEDLATAPTFTAGVIPTNITPPV